MSNIAIFKIGKRPQYLRSVNTPDYSDDSDVLINPDISAVEEIDLRYWKRVGGDIEEMTKAEKDAVDASNLQARKDSVELDEGQKGLISLLLSKGISVTESKLITEIQKQIGGETL